MDIGESTLIMVMAEPKDKELQRLQKEVKGIKRDRMVLFSLIGAGMLMLLSFRYEAADTQGGKISYGYSDEFLLKAINAIALAVGGGGGVAAAVSVYRNSQEQDDRDEESTDDQ